MLGPPAPDYQQPTYARGVAPEGLLRPAGGYDPTQWEDQMQLAWDQSRRSLPTTNEQSVNRHQMPIRQTPPSELMWGGQRVTPQWTPEDLARGRRTPLPEQGSDAYLRDLGTSTRENIRRGGQAVERIAGGATSFLTKDQAGTSEKDPLGALGQLAGSVVSTIFDPFTEAGSRVIVTSDPTLRAEFIKRGGGSGAAESVLDDLRTAALNRANDPNVPEGDRFDAGGIATILGLYKAGEFGAPQVIAGLGKLGVAAIRNQLRYELRTSGAFGSSQYQDAAKADVTRRIAMGDTSLPHPAGEQNPLALESGRPVSTNLNPETRSGRTSTQPQLRLGENGQPRPATPEELRQQDLAKQGITTPEQWGARAAQRAPREVQLYAEKPSGLRGAVEGWVFDEQGMARLDLGMGNLFYHVSPHDIEAPAIGMPAKRYRQEGGIMGMFSPPKVITVKSKAFFMSQDPKLLNEVTKVRLGATGAPGKTHSVIKVYGGEIESDRVLRLDTMPDQAVQELSLNLLRGTRWFRDKIINSGLSEGDLRDQGLISAGNFAQWIDDPQIIQKLRKQYDAIVFDDLGYGKSVAVVKPEAIQGFRQLQGRVTNANEGRTHQRVNLQTGEPAGTRRDAAPWNRLNEILIKERKADLIQRAYAYGRQGIADPEHAPGGPAPEGLLRGEGGSLQLDPSNTFGKFLRSDEGYPGKPQLTAIEGGKNLPMLQRPAPTGRDAQNYLAAAGERDRMQARLAQSNKPTTDPETTWVFTDVQGSTDLIREHGNDIMSQVMATQKKILTDVFTAEDGELVRSTGDGFFWRFPSQAQAATAAAEAQKFLGAAKWPAGTSPKVRIGMHSGPATPGSAASGVDYVGEPIHYASRVTNSGRGGDIVVSEDVAKAIGLVDQTGGYPIGRGERVQMKDYGTKMVYRVKPQDVDALSQQGQGYWANHPAVKDIEQKLHEPQYRMRNVQIVLDPPRAQRVAEAFWQKYAPDAKQEKKAIIMLGYSGSGKSTVAHPGGTIDTTGYLPLGADDFKPIILDDYLKQAEPYPIHGNLTENNIARASDELRKKVYDRAVSEGYNLVIGPVGRNPAEVMDQIAELKRAGFHVTLPFMDVPAQVAIGRTIKRFLEAGGLDSTMRYIRPGYTYGAVGKPQALVAQLLRNKATGKGVQADDIQIWDGSGRQSRLVHSTSGAGLPQSGRVSTGDVAGGGNGSGGQRPPASPPGQVQPNATTPAPLAGTPRPGPLPVSGSPNFGYNQFPENTQDTLAKMQEAVQPALEKARPVISFAEQNAPTDAPIWELASKLPVAGEVSRPAAQVRQAVADLLNQTQEYRNLIDAGTITPQQQAEYAMKLKIAALGRVAEVGAVSESARTTGGVQMPLRQQLRTTTSARAIDELFGDLAQNHPEKLDQIATALSTLGGDPLKVMRLMKQVATKADFWQRFDEYYRANVLWNIATHVTNTSSGLFQAALLGARETLYSATDIRPMSGTRGVVAFSEDTAMSVLGFGQGYIQAYQMLRGIKDMLPMNADKYGGALGFSHTGALGSPAEAGGPQGFFGLGKYYGPILRTPFRFLEAADLFQTAPMYNALLWRNAGRLAREEGVRGWGAINKRAQEILQTLPDGVKAEEAFRQAEEFALHGSGDAAKAIGELRRAVPALRPIVLFINTPTNLISLSARFSPMGFARLPYAGVKKLSGRESTDFDPRRAFIEAGIGSAITAGFLFMLQGDNAIGLTPKSKAEQEAWESEGRQPLSIRASEYPILGPMLSAYYNSRGQDPSNVWVGPQLLGPLLIPYLIAAAYHEVTRAPSKDPIENQIAVAAANAGKTLMDQIPLFSTYSMISNASNIANPDAAMRLLARLGLPVLPAESLIKMVGDWTDGFRRDAKTFDEILKATIPGLREQVRPKLDVLGKPLPNNVVPFDVGPRAKAQIEPDPVLAKSEELRKAHPEEWSGLVKPGRNVAGSDLNYDQAQRYVELAGTERRKLLGTLLDMPEFQSLSGTEQAKAYHATDLEALREGRKKLGLEMAQAAQDITGIQRGADIALAGANNNYEKGQVLVAMRDNGKLRPEVANGLDSGRNQSDPLKGNYQLSVAEYMRGVELIDKYRAAPAFATGDSANPQDWPKEWSAAADAATTYNELHNVYERLAKSKGVTIQTLPEYSQLIRYYSEAANGLLARYYTQTGTVRAGLVSAERKAITADPLWSHFSGSAVPQPAVPYRFPVPQPVLPSAEVPQDQQLAAVAP